MFSVWLQSLFDIVPACGPIAVTEEWNVVWLSLDQIITGVGSLLGSAE